MTVLIWPRHDASWRKGSESINDKERFLVTLFFRSGSDASKNGKRAMVISEIKRKA